MIKSTQILTFAAISILTACSSPDPSAYPQQGIGSPVQGLGSPERKIDYPEQRIAYPQKGITKPAEKE